MSAANLLDKDMMQAALAEARAAMAAGCRQRRDDDEEGG